MSVIAMDCRQWLRTIDSESVDSVITDPPYPEIDRSYGRWTVLEWREMMDDVVSECRRVLKPSGSAIFILAPNSERIGKARTWLWHFMADWGDRWNLVQDIWWWNHATMPTAHTNGPAGLCRPSLRACVWLGEPDCYRNQSQVLVSSKFASIPRIRENTAMVTSPSGHQVRHARVAATVEYNGGATPFNVLPIANTDSNSKQSAAAKGHGAGTPYKLCDWWVRYVTPPGGSVADPFCGSGTTGIAAVGNGRRFQGCEMDSMMVKIANRAISDCQMGLAL